MYDICVYLCKSIMHFQWDVNAFFNSEKTLPFLVYSRLGFQQKALTRAVYKYTAIGTYMHDTFPLILVFEIGILLHSPYLAIDLIKPVECCDNSERYITNIVSWFSVPF